MCYGVLFNERRLKVDDPCGAISVHGYCGWFGAVSVGIFADGTYGSGWNGVGAASYLGRTGQGVTGLLHGDTLVIPYGMADTATAVATLRWDDLRSALLAS